MSNVGSTTSGDLDGGRIKRGPGDRRRGPNEKPRTDETMCRSVFVCWVKVGATRRGAMVNVGIAVVADLRPPVCLVPRHALYMYHTFEVIYLKAAATDLVASIALNVYYREFTRGNASPIAFRVEAQNSRGCWLSFRPLDIPFKMLLMTSATVSVGNNAYPAPATDAGVNAVAVALFRGPKGARDGHKCQHKNQHQTD